MLFSVYVINSYQILTLLVSFLVCMKPPYEVSETGWGEFEVIIKIYFVDPTERPVSFYYLYFINIDIMLIVSNI